MKLGLTAIKHNKSIWALSDQMIYSGNNFLVTIIMARLINTTAFGYYASLILFMYLVISMLSALIIQPLQVNLPNVPNLQIYLSFNFWTQSGLILLACLTIYGVAHLPDGIPATYRVLAVPGCILLAGYALQDFFRKVFLAQKQLGWAIAVDGLSTAAQLSLLLTAWWWGNSDLKYLICALGIAPFAGILPAIISVRPFHFSARRWRDHIVMHYRQGRWLFMTAIIQWWSSNLFVIASGVFLGIQALGAFRLVQTLFGTLNLLLQVFENHTLPEVARLLRHSRDDARMYLKQTTYKSAGGFGFILVLLFIFAKPLIILAVGPEYGPYAFVVRGMSLLYFLIFLAYPIRLALRSLILNQYFFLGYAATLLFSLLSFRYLLEHYQLIGVLTGLIGSQLILIIFWYAILVKHQFVLWK